jgi:hypothetical protein
MLGSVGLAPATRHDEVVTEGLEPGQLSVDGASAQRASSPAKREASPIVLFDSHRVLGATVAFAGACGLAVLLPWTVRWLGTGSRGAPGTPETGPDA